VWVMASADRPFTKESCRFLADWNSATCWPSMESIPVSYLESQSKGGIRDLLVCWIREGFAS